MSDAGFSYEATRVQSEARLAECRRLMRAAYLEDEAAAVARLVKLAGLDEAARETIVKDAVKLTRDVRKGKPGLMESFLAEYGLSTREGVALMTLAEALLRVPDADTADILINDKLNPHEWAAHIGHSPSPLVNTSTWALALTGTILRPQEREGVTAVIRGLIKRLGEPVVRVAVGQAMKILGAQFVLGQTITEAIEHGQSYVRRGYTYSYDMLGEAALTERDAARYFDAYLKAIHEIGATAKSADIRENPGISVKLSALHARYQYAQKEWMTGELSERLLTLAKAAKDYNLGLNVDAEEAERLDLSLDVIEKTLSSDDLEGWDGFGVVVQAYGQRAAHVIDWLGLLAERLDRRIMIRLVKGAYWDMEIKRAQVLGLEGFPVFTLKHHSDISYIACARKLLGMARVYPQFATHNAHTASAILHLAGDNENFEFQRLHGMGEAQHDILIRERGTRCRIYAPVGAHRELLAYLVRRLLENGANSSFVNQINNAEIPPEEIAADPFAIAEREGYEGSAEIACGSRLYGERRRNSRGYDLNDPLTADAVLKARAEFSRKKWHFNSLSPVAFGRGEAFILSNPAALSETVGSVTFLNEEGIGKLGQVFDVAEDSLAGWHGRGVALRGVILERIADLYEKHADELMAIIAREAGKTWPDCVGEVREAVDFLRYYATEAQVTGLYDAPRGIFVCISPWNFPLAIFTGQIAAALVAGNAVIAKPAEQTPLIAARAVELMHEAGVPREVLQLLLGGGDLGAALCAEPRVRGVCFTGSTEVARLIDRQLARTAPEAVLIAETGGLNAMIVDSTALPEQAVRDIIASAFQSAGQRCSALRVLYVQDDVAEPFLEMLFGAMDALRIGDPGLLQTDVGPIIDREAQENLAAYCRRMTDDGRLLKVLEAPEGGYFLPPHVFAIKGIEELERETFGPVLHVARFKAEEIDDVVERINASGYGLTFGLHTRIEQRRQAMAEQVHAGNIYINRNQIGAVVGSQPFGGQGLSGTGPKAGGPNYLPRFTRPREVPGGAAARVTGDPVTLKDLQAALGRLAGRKARSLTSSDIDALRHAFPQIDSLIMCQTAQLRHGSLPGPTGEDNILSVSPRGTILCLGPSREALGLQVLTALLTGNRVLVVHGEDDEKVNLLVKLGLAVEALQGSWQAADVAALDVDGVAFAARGDLHKSLRLALAAREGAILPLISSPDGFIDYVHEKTICVDTTAAGGNVSLLARGGERRASRP